MYVCACRLKKQGKRSHTDKVLVLVKPTAAVIGGRLARFSVRSLTMTLSLGVTRERAARSASTSVRAEFLMVVADSGLSGGTSFGFVF